MRGRRLIVLSTSAHYSASLLLKTAFQVGLFEIDQGSYLTLLHHHRMQKAALSDGWMPISTAPANLELELGIYEGGEYHTLVFPCKRDGTGWRDVSANRPMPLQPTHWRPWTGKFVYSAEEEAFIREMFKPTEDQIFEGSWLAAFRQHRVSHPNEMFCPKRHFRSENIIPFEWYVRDSSPFPPKRDNTTAA
jgi:hypothetical protein